MSPTKFSFGLAIFLLSGAWNAGAQTISCSPTAIPYDIRAEGLAELTGDIVVFCYRSEPGPSPVPVTVRVTMTNTNVTNNRDFGPGSDVTDALLFSEVPCYWYPCEPPPPPQFGQRINDTTLEWNSVNLPLPPGTGSSALLRIKNIRVKAFGLSGGPALASLSVSGSSPIVLPPYPVALGFPRTGLVASLLPPSEFESFRIRLLEGFPFAFKVLGSPTTEPAFVVPNQEDGFRTPGSGVNNGGASQGTRFIIRFTGFSSGLRILVPHAVPIGPDPQGIRRVTGTDANGAGGCYYLGCLEPPPAGSVGPVDVSREGGFAVYEVVTTSPFSLDQVDIPVQVCHGPADGSGCRSFANPQSLQGSQVRASLAPVSTIDVSDMPAPEPRFVELGIPQNVPR